MYRVIAVTVRTPSVECGYAAGSDDIHFEIYRFTKDKEARTERTRIAIAGERPFVDRDLESATNYYYTVRAVSKK